MSDSNYNPQVIRLLPFYVSNLGPEEIKTTIIKQRSGSKLKTYIKIPHAQNEVVNTRGKYLPQI